jgi:hypothetical protein
MASSKSNQVTSAIGIVAGLAGFSLVAVYPALFGLMIIILGSSLLGGWYGSWYAKKKQYNESWIKFLFWSNLCTWFIPIIGFFTATATYQINSRNKGNDRVQFMWITGVCYALSLVNAFFGAKIAAGL